MADEPITNSKTHRFGDWEFNTNDYSLRNRLTDTVERLEPRVGDLLLILLRENQSVVAKETLIKELWPKVVVGDDTLAKTVSRLRTALGESASHPNLVETIPKRGYRIKHTETQGLPSGSRSTQVWFALMFGVLVLTVFIWWSISNDRPNQELAEKLARADGLYMEFEEQSNEAALALYEDVLSVEQSNSHAKAGVANAMVQRVVRWPENQPANTNERPSVTSALASGQLSTPEAKMMLERARLMAEKAVRESPQSSQALKALGFVYSAEGKLPRAIEQYERAISANSKEWRSMINLGELLQISEKPKAALDMFTQAYLAMQESYDDEPQHIGPWQPVLGVAIAKLHMQAGDHKNSLSWAEKVLELEPFEREASSIFVSASLTLGQKEQARSFCESYAIKLKVPKVCTSLSE